MDISQMSFSAGCLIIAVVVIRGLAMHRLPKKTFLALWGIVICRLLIPFSVPFRLSFYTGLDMLRRAALDAAYVSAPAGSAGMPAGGMADMGKLAGAGASSVSGLTVVWTAGICIFTIFFLAVYIKCRREFQTALPVENGFINLWQRQHPLRRPVQIRQSDRIKAPLTYGIWRPVLLLPKATDWTDETRLQYILAHEYVHIRRFDALAKLLMTSAVCIHWFNPLVWVMYVLANRDVELSCDEAVVRTFGETARSDYARMLIGLEEKKSRLTPLCNNFSKNAIEERIRAIMKIKKHPVPVIIVAVLLIAGVAAGFATSKATVGHGSNAPDHTETLAGWSSPTAPGKPADDKETAAKLSLYNDADSPSYEIKKVYYAAEPPQTEINGAPVQRRYYPVVHKYYYNRTDPVTGNKQISLDDGSTWLYIRHKQGNNDGEVSADGVAWSGFLATIQEPKYAGFGNCKYYYARTDPDTGQELARSYDQGVTWLYFRNNAATGRAEVSADGVAWQLAPNG